MFLVSKPMALCMIYAFAAFISIVLNNEISILTPKLRFSSTSLVPMAAAWAAVLAESCSDQRVLPTFVCAAI